MRKRSRFPLTSPSPQGAHLSHPGHTAPSVGAGSSSARSRVFALACLALFAAAMLLFAGKAQALNYVYNSNQDFWAVNDAAIPGLDTGSIQRTSPNALQ